VEDAAKELYIRALKLLPPDIKQGFSALAARETDSTAQSVLGKVSEYGPSRYFDPRAFATLRVRF